MNCRFTFRANKHNQSVLIISLLKDHFFCILVTFCTKIMRWFGVAHRFFKSIYETNTFPGGVKLISLLFCFPCFYVSNFFFKCAYFINCRRLLRLSGERIALGSKNSALKLNNFPLGIRSTLRLYNTLCNIRRKLETTNSTLI